MTESVQLDPELIDDPAVREIVSLKLRVALLESYNRIAVALASGAITVAGILVGVLLFR
jgi:hypothetical protein